MSHAGLNARERKAPLRWSSIAADEKGEHALRLVVREIKQNPGLGVELQFYLALDERVLRPEGKTYLAGLLDESLSPGGRDLVVRPPMNAEV